jgi:hypothetical protein
LPPSHLDHKDDSTLSHRSTTRLVFSPCWLLARVATFIIARQTIY